MSSMPGLPLPFNRITKCHDRLQQCRCLQYSRNKQSVRLDEATRQHGGHLLGLCPVLEAAQQSTDPAHNPPMKCVSASGLC